MSQRPIIVFDVNETLLNLETIRPTFDRIFTRAIDPGALRRERERSMHHA
jgi:2-haloacid dehalogenase